MYIKFLLILQILLNQNINNIYKPVCKNCIYYRENVFDEKLGKCRIYKFKNLVTGDIEEYYAKIARENENMCSEDGVSYAENNEFNNYIDIEDI